MVKNLSHPTMNSIDEKRLDEFEHYKKAKPRRKERAPGTVKLIMVALIALILGLTALFGLGPNTTKETKMSTSTEKVSGNEMMESTSQVTGFSNTSSSSTPSEGSSE